MNKFTKSDLRDGDIVMYDNGEMRIVKNNELYDDHDRLKSSIDLYDKDLKCLGCLRGDPLDIVKVYRQIWKREEPTITADEKIILRNIESKHKYIARDHNGKLYVYSEKPEKRECDWMALSYMGSLSAINHLFKMVKWEDEEPWLIEDLLNLPVKKNVT